MALSLRQLAALAVVAAIVPTTFSSVITHQADVLKEVEADFMVESVTEDAALDKWLELVAPVNATKVTARMADADILMSPWNPLPNGLAKRQRVEDENGALLCPDNKCVDHSCCGPDNKCGYGSDFCGDGCKGDCDATAMCGKFSDGGNVKCGLDLCCSWGGWCGTADVHCIGPNEHALCQEGYGKCEIIRPETCGENSGTADGRMIGYYQSWNTRDRTCNRISPSQIKTEGYTHLFFSFASIDPDTYKVKPWVEEDKALMREFTQLKGKGRDLQPWIAVGGWAFSDPDQPTHTTWSDLCSDQGRRSAFIASLIDFMDEYGFTGADLDWEYPGTAKRGGKLADEDNFVQLLKEMREAFGTKYGISLTLAPDYWYLRYFDVGRLQNYADHLGFMAYDLHGFWDSDVEALGSVVRGQANIEEIANNTLPLAYAGVDPSKITMGIAWYGRGYTLADPSCNTLGCPFLGPSKPGKCTNSAGVLSLVEIKEMIANGEAKSNSLPGIGMKELVWDNQWVGYDDEETVELKRKFANNQCFGGLMAWSVDFNSGDGSGTDAPKSEDGYCGPDHNGTTCPGSGFGDCCSTSGYCGSTDGHCGSACVSGDCKDGLETTDGRCGAGFNNAKCGSWSHGPCCSAGGYCGESDGHCGDGCQSGCNGEDPDDGDDGDDDEGSPQPYEPDPADDKTLAACPYTPKTMDEIFNLDFYNELPAHCVPKYMVPVLHNMLETLTKRYNEIMEDDYDYYFGVYSGYLVETASEVTRSFIKDTGDDYFDCDIWQQYPCCTNCEYLGESCDGCIEKCVIESSGDDGVEWHLRDQPCPPNYSKRGMGDDWEQSIFWDFKDDEAKANFYAAAAAEVGAPEDKFKIAERSTIPNWHLSASCARQAGFNGWDAMDEVCKRTGYWYNVPYVDGFEKDDVVNPKDIVKNTIENADVLREPMAEAAFKLMVDDYEGDGHDLVDALILPVFMLQESVEYMEVVIKTGKEIKEAEKTALIVNLLSALMIVISFGGSSLASAGFATLGRTLVYLAEVGNTALGLHAVISVPKSAPLLIFGLVMSAVGIRDVGKVAQAAKLRRGMKFEEISAFSKEAARLMDSVAAFNKKPSVPQMCRYA